MSSQNFPRMPLARAQRIADRFMQYLTPFVSKMEVAGSVRRESPDVGDIELVALALDEFAMARCLPEGYKGMTVNGERLKRFIYPESQVQIELYLPQAFDYGRILAIRIGSSGYAHYLMMEANRHGWIGTDKGLRRKKECEKKGSVWKMKPEYADNPTLPPVFETERSFIEFLNLPYLDPVKRSWVSNNPAYNYNV